MTTEIPSLAYTTDEKFIETRLRMARTLSPEKRDVVFGHSQVPLRKEQKALGEIEGMLDRHHHLREQMDRMSIDDQVFSLQVMVGDVESRRRSKAAKLGHLRKAGILTADMYTKGEDGKLVLDTSKLYATGSFRTNTELGLVRSLADYEVSEKSVLYKKLLAGAQDKSANPEADTDQSKITDLETYRKSHRGGSRFSSGKVVASLGLAAAIAFGSAIPASAETIVKPSTPVTSVDKGPDSAKVVPSVAPAPKPTSGKENSLKDPKKDSKDGKNGSDQPGENPPGTPKAGEPGGDIQHGTPGPDHKGTPNPDDEYHKTPTVKPVTSTPTPYVTPITSTPTRTASPTPSLTVTPTSSPTASATATNTVTVTATTTRTATAMPPTNTATPRSIISFPSCPEPGGRLIVRHDQPGDLHQIIGMDHKVPGTDAVFDLSGNYESIVEQCFCPPKDAANANDGIQTDWIDVENNHLTQAEIDKYIMNGFTLVEKGDDWGLNPHKYLAKNFNFNCENIITPTPTLTTTPTSTVTVSPTTTSTPGATLTFTSTPTSTSVPAPSVTFTPTVETTVPNPPQPSSGGGGGNSSHGNPTTTATPGTTFSECGTEFLGPDFVQELQSQDAANRNGGERVINPNLDAKNVWNNWTPDVLKKYRDKFIQLFCAKTPVATSTPTAVPGGPIPIPPAPPEETQPPLPGKPEQPAPPASEAPPEQPPVEAPPAQVPIQIPLKSADRSEPNSLPASSDGSVFDAFGAPILGDEYTVQPGDSVWAISGRAYGQANVEKIAKANQLKNAAMIFPGQVFRIPR